MEQQEMTTPDRRSVMQVCGLLGLGLLGVPTLVACGSDDDSGDAATTGGAAAGGALAKLADIPVGSALVTKDASGAPIAIIRTAETTVSAVTAVCTHQGTTVAPVSGELVCPSHDSRFGFDGSVKKGPATTPLKEVKVKIDGENVVAA